MRSWSCWLGIVVLKPVLTGLTLAAGATGGRLAPSLAAGSSAGAALAIALQACGVEASVAVLAMAGAGAVLATTQRAPVFGIVFTWELARAGAWTLVALFAVVLAVTLLASPDLAAHRGLAAADLTEPVAGAACDVSGSLILPNEHILLSGSQPAATSPSESLWIVTTTPHRLVTRYSPARPTPMPSRPDGPLSPRASPLPPSPCWPVPRRWARPWRS